VRPLIPAEVWPLSQTEVWSLSPAEVWSLSPAEVWSMSRSKEPNQQNILHTMAQIEPKKMAGFKPKTLVQIEIE